jgi:hypothetical protein
MNIASKLLLASGLALSLVTPVMAQEQNTLEERNAYLFMNGKMIRMRVESDATHAMIMRNFRPLPNGTMIYSSGGKLYIGQDRRMRNHQMMSTMIFGPELGAGSQR